MPDNTSQIEEDQRWERERASDSMSVTINVHGLTADLVAVHPLAGRPGRAAVDLGGTCVTVIAFGTPDELIAIGEAIVRQAAQLKVEARVDAAVTDTAGASAVEG